MRPRYLNTAMLVSRWPYAQNHSSVPSQAYFVVILRWLIYFPLVHWAVLRWRPFMYAHINIMSHKEHRGCGRFPSSKMTIVSHMWWCTKCTLIPVWIADCIWHPSISHTRGPDACRNYTWTFGVSPGGGVSHCAPRLIPCCFWKWSARNTNSRSVSPSPIIHYPNAASYCLLTAQHGWQVIPTVSPMFVLSPTRPNRPKRVSNPPWSHSGCVEAIKPSSVWNNAASHWIYRPHSSSPASPSSYRNIQCCTIMSTTTLNMGGDSVPTWITFRYPLKGAL